MYVIKHIMKFHAPSSNKSEIVRDENNEPLLFGTHSEARKEIERIESTSYCLRHNQYGYDLLVVDLDKPRNAAWYDKEGQY